MKKLFCLTCLFLYTVGLQAATITIRADEWLPINGNPGTDHQGFMIDITAKILAEHGDTVEYKEMPWERSLEKVRDGSFDCVAGASTDDAPDFIFPKNPMGMVSSNFFTKQGSDWALNGIDSLKGRKLGAISGYAYGDDIDAYIEENKNSPDVQLMGGNGALENQIKKLVAGRIDIIVETKMVMEAKLKDLNMAGQFEDKGSLQPRSPIYIACSPAPSKADSSKQVVQRLDDGIAKMRESGDLAKILESYGLKDWAAQ